VAGREKETSIQTFLFIAQGIAEDLNIPEAEARYLTINSGRKLNGIVSLLNSRLLREVEEQTEPLIKRLIADICERYHPLVIKKSLKIVQNKEGHIMLIQNASADKPRLSPTGLILHALLKVMAANFNHRSALKNIYNIRWSAGFRVRHPH